MYYPIVIHFEADTCYGVSVPDVPGCFSAGETLEQAIEQAQLAIEFHFESLVEEGCELPKPSSLQNHQQNPDYAGGTWALAKVDTLQFLGKAQRLNISLPSRLVAKIDHAVEHNSEYKDRSKFLAEAAIKALAG